MNNQESISFSNNESYDIPSEDLHYLDMPFPNEILELDTTDNQQGLLKSDSYHLKDDRTKFSNRKLDSNNWLDDLHIDYVLIHFQSIYSHVKIYTISKQQSAAFRHQYTQNFFDDDDLIFVIQTNNHWVTLTNIEILPSAVSCRTNKPIFMYESLNKPDYINAESVKDILRTMFPSFNELVIHKVSIASTQKGLNDCGLFALAYVQSLCKNQDPSLIVYDQEKMRTNYNNFIDSNNYFVDEVNNFNGMAVNIALNPIAINFRTIALLV